MARASGILDRLAARLRRALLGAGLGFASAVVGSLLSAPLAMRLADRLRDAPDWVTESVLSMVARLWILAVVPAIAYGLARAAPTFQRSTVVTAALTGELFFAALEWASGGAAAVVRSGAWVLVRLITLGAGLWLSFRAMRTAQDAADRSAQAVRQQNEVALAEYESFAREAQRLAALRDGDPEPPPSPPASSSHRGEG